MATFASWLLDRDSEDGDIGGLARLWREVTPGKISSPSGIERVLARIEGEQGDPWPGGDWRAALKLAVSQYTDDRERGAQHILAAVPDEAPRAGLADDHPGEPPSQYRHQGDPAWESADGDPEGYGDPPVRQAVQRATEAGLAAARAHDVPEADPQTLRYGPGPVVTDGLVTLDTIAEQLAVIGATLALIAEWLGIGDDSGPLPSDGAVGDWQAAYAEAER